MREMRDGAMTPVVWLMNRAAAYLLDAEHCEQKRVERPQITPEVRRIIAAELEACAKDFEGWNPNGNGTRS